MAGKLLCESYVCDPRPFYPLRIAVKRYWDPENALPAHAHQNARDEALTLVCTHGVGYHKEQWEPTFEHLFELYGEGQKKQHGPRNKIREIWAIDAPNHGDSAILNEEVLLRGGYTPMCK